MVARGRVHDAIPVLERRHERRMNGTTPGRVVGEELGDRRTDRGNDGRTRSKEVAITVSSTTINIPASTAPSRQPSVLDTPVPAPSSGSFPALSTATHNAIQTSLSPEDLPPTRFPQALSASETSRAVTPTISLSKPTFTIQAGGNKSSTASILPITSIIALADVGARIDTGSLPGTNQDAPSLDVVPNVISLATPDASTTAFPRPAATVLRPMPGKNQPKPAMDAAAAASFMVANSLGPLITPTPSRSVIRSEPASNTSSALSLRVPTPREISSSSSSRILSSGPQSSFLTFTRIEQGKELVSVTSSVMSSPQAVTMVQPLSALFSSAPVATAVLTVPTSTPSSTPLLTIDSQRSSRLTPLARTLFITFGVLGAVTLLVAFGIIIIIRTNKKRSRTQQTQPNDRTFDGHSDQDHSRVTTHISVSSPMNDNPFLTESEKAIVARAASPDGKSNADITAGGYRFTEAINAFVSKSRRLTYKISP